jgi:hypothetical protein
VEAVLDRKYLGAGEIRRMILAENIKTWYDDRKRDGAKWVDDNPEAAGMLTLAHRLAVEEGLIEE